MDIVTALASVTAALKLAKELRDIDHQLDKADLKLKVAQMTEALAKAQTALTDAEAELRAKGEEISKLKAGLQFRATKLVDRGQFRFFADEAGNAKGTPICPRCEQRGEYLAVVQDRSKGIGKITYYCPGCKANYGPHVPKG